MITRVIPGVMRCGLWGFLMILLAADAVGGRMRYLVMPGDDPLCNMMVEVSVEELAVPGSWADADRAFLEQCLSCLTQAISRYEPDQVPACIATNLNPFEGVDLYGFLKPGDPAAITSLSKAYLFGSFAILSGTTGQGDDAAPFAVGFSRLDDELAELNRKPFMAKQENTVMALVNRRGRPTTTDPDHYSRKITYDAGDPSRHPVDVHFQADVFDPPISVPLFDESAKSNCPAEVRTIVAGAEALFQGDTNAFVALWRHEDQITLREHLAAGNLNSLILQFPFQRIASYDILAVLDFCRLKVVYALKPGEKVVVIYLIDQGEGPKLAHDTIQDEYGTLLMSMLSSEAFIEQLLGKHP